jgi:hypothetical protein
MADQHSTSDKPCVKILGQEFYYPTNWLGTVAVTVTALLVGATICVSLGIPYIWSSDAGRAHIEKMFSQASISSAGHVTSTSNHGRLGIWTPSEMTYSDIQPPDPYKWRKGRTSIEIEAFENGLEAFATAWRRFPVEGKGSGGKLIGFWYEISTKQGFNEKQFFDYYRKHWKATTDIYFEYLSHPGGYRK